jgi:hypothetical protein
VRRCGNIASAFIRYVVCRIKVILRELPSVVVKTEVARSMPLCKPLSPERNGP